MKSAHNSKYWSEENFQYIHYENKKNLGSDWKTHSEEKERDRKEEIMIQEEPDKASTISMVWYEKDIVSLDFNVVI